MAEERKFIDRIDIKGSQLYLDGKSYFTSPNTMKDTRVIRVVGILEKPHGATEVHIGTGGCCFGYLINVLQGRPDAIEFMTPLNYNIHDLMPVQLQRQEDCKIPGEMTPTKVLTTGYGCHGSGVHLVSLHSDFRKTIVPGEEFRPLLRTAYPVYYPRFRIEQDRILLSIVGGHCIPKDTEPKSYEFIPSAVTSTLDLTDRLRDLELDFSSDKPWKIDIGATIEAANRYQIKRSK